MDDQGLAVLLVGRVVEFGQLPDGRLLVGHRAPGYETVGLEALARAVSADRSDDLAGEDRKARRCRHVQLDAVAIADRSRCLRKKNTFTYFCKPTIMYLEEQRAGVELALKGVAADLAHGGALLLPRETWVLELAQVVLVNEQLGHDIDALVLHSGLAGKLFKLVAVRARLLVRIQQNIHALLVAVVLCGDLQRLDAPGDELGLELALLVAQMVRWRGPILYD